MVEEADAERSCDWVGESSDESGCLAPFMMGGVDVVDVKCRYEGVVV